MKSINPATQETVWEGPSSTQEDVQEAVKRAKEAFLSWKRLSFETRAGIARAYAQKVLQNRELLAKTISMEMGKPYWESLTEVQAMHNKVEISIEAYEERCKEKHYPNGRTHFLPYGVVGVIGPFNFPGHLPNGHIVPALLAGNCLLFKPSEKTPKVGKLMVELWKEAALPEGVCNLLQGGKEVATAILQQPDVAGIYFTGSVGAGCAIQEQSKAFPGRILALEMGGNNPLVVTEVQDLQATIYTIIQSAFLTSGQRCSCARRLIITNEAILDPLVKATKALTVGPYTDTPEPFMGPVVSKEAADSLVTGYEGLLKYGGKALLPLERSGDCFLKPAIVDMTGQKRVDQELFGPILQVIIVKNLAEAIAEANSSAYGLTASLLSARPEEFEKFYDQVRAGCINWNMPTTGASSRAPFGGLGLSGNHRPSGYFAADYCAYPVASQLADKVALPEMLLPGVHLP